MKAEGEHHEHDDTSEKAKNKNSVKQSRGGLLVSVERHIASAEGTAKALAACCNQNKTVRWRCCWNECIILRRRAVATLKGSRWCSSSFTAVCASLFTLERGVDLDPTSTNELDEPDDEDPDEEEDNEPDELPELPLDSERLDPELEPEPEPELE